MRRFHLMLVVLIGVVGLVACGSGAAPTAPEAALAQPVNIDSTELAAMLEQPDRPFLLDVRTPQESQAASIPGTDKLIPVDQLAARVDELDPNQEIVIYCRSGNRSSQAVRILQEAGFTNLRNLEGGIISWSGPVESRPTQ